MDEAAAIAALQARGRFGIRLGLGRTRALLRALGSPERDLRGVLIGGTNGKGSVQAMVAAVLRAQGLRVGQTPKPHLVSYRERIAVDGRPIASADLGPLLTEVLAAADRVEPRHGPPTEFETLTCAAFLWFARSGVEVAVIEVGLGGRLDATHAWDGGVATITNVALDHTEYLGETLTAIAREKAAIIERGDLAVTGAQGDALQVIRTRARRLEVPLTVSQPLPVVATRRWGMTLRHPTLGDLDLGLAGPHQAMNAAVAVDTLRALEDARITHVEQDALRRGLADVRWPGRLELLEVETATFGRAADTGAPPSARPAGATRTPGTVDVLLDGAHNPDGATALAEAMERMRDHLAPGRVTLIVGVMGDKDVAGVLQALRTSAALRDGRVIATTVPDSPRAMDPGALASAWGRDARPIADPDAALAAGIAAAATEDGPLVVAGSLYLVGHVRGRLTGGVPA
ncbi:MAG: bifunctional folylpolyglutamate synthase/dihydrofolate synthase [Chloroflexi bacterium]|nr:bifunctional folylpolyglutamate synthase/dihydrofolate synthase [Chloroflexota bacterium]